MKIPLKILLFSLFLLIDLASTGGHTDAHDGVVYLGITENMVTHYSAKLDPNASIFEKSGTTINQLQYLYGFSTGKTLSKGESFPPIYVADSPFLPALGVPLYKIATTFSFDPMHFVPFFLNPIILALTSLMIFLLSNEIYFSKKISFVLSLLFSVCSFAWPYITSMMLQPLAALTLVSSLYFFFLSRRKDGIKYPALSSLFLGLTMLAHIGHLILIPGFFIFNIYHYRKKKKALAVFLGIFFTMVLFQGMLNYTRFNSFTEFGYGQNELISFHSQISGIIGIILSPGFGLLVNFPIFALFPFSIYLLYKHFSKSLAILFTYTFVSSWIFFGTLPPPIWHGFGSWGPRYMLPDLPFIALAIGSFLQNYKTKITAKITVIILAASGFMVNLFGVLVWYQIGYSYGLGIEHINTIKDGYKLFEWDPLYAPVVEHIKVLLSSYPSQLDHNLGLWKISLVPCNYDNYIYCNFGVSAILLLAAGIIALQLIIIKEIRKTS